MKELLAMQQIDDSPEDYLRQCGDVFAVFGENTQDSGNISYGVLVGGTRYFVKTAGLPDDPKPVLSHSERVGLLRTAVSLSQTMTHPALVSLLNVIESPAGPLLVYEWADGELLRYVLPRFRQLPVAEIVAVLDTIYALHAQLAEAGWIMQDFYDGCLLYDFDKQRLKIMDLDFYRKRPFINERGRLFGSSRFMSPEEFERGATIDQRSNVYTMGRTAVNLLSDGSLDRAAFRGSDGQYGVVLKACCVGRNGRYATVAEFGEAWRASRG